MVQGYKRRWFGGQPSSRPTLVDGSIELLVFQYYLSCLVLSCISPLGCSQASLPCFALIRSITVALVDITDTVLDAYNTNERWVVKKMKPEYVNMIVAIMPIIY
jgi:hypothetical protein